MCRCDIKKILNYILLQSGLSNDGLNKYLSNFSYQMGDYIFSLITSLIVGIAVARYLGPEMYGIIAFATAVYAVSVIIVSLGVDDIIMKDMIHLAEKQGSIQGSALFIKFAAAFLVYSIIFIYCFINYSGEKLYSVLIIGSAVLFQPLSVFSCIFLINAQAKYTSLARMISYTLSSLLKIILIIFKAPVTYFAFAVFIDYAVLYITVILMYRYKNYTVSGWRIDISYIKYILKNAVPLFAAVLFYTFYQKVTVIIISSMYSDYTSGIYSAAIRLTEIWYMVPAVLMTAFFPAVVTAKQMCEEEYNKRIKTLFYVTTIPFILMALFAALLSPLIIKILYGEAYIKSSIVLSLTIWSVPFISFYVISSKCFILENKVKHLLLRSALSFILIIVLNYILGGAYYLKGFSIALLISSFFSFFLIDLFFKDTRKLFFIKLSSIFLPCIYILNLLKKGKNYS